MDKIAVSKLLSLLSVSGKEGEKGRSRSKRSHCISSNGVHGVTRRPCQCWQRLAQCDDQQGKAVRGI